MTNPDDRDPAGGEERQAFSPPLPRGGCAVMARRHEPDDSLDYFPTPPWATRAFLLHAMPLVQPGPLRDLTVWEPACGEGHMAAVLGEEPWFGRVIATDVFDYGYGGVRDFLGLEAAPMPKADWIITNPPFNLAELFLDRALERARLGVAFLLRTVFEEGAERYARIYAQRPPTHKFVSAERIPMTRGRWLPNAKTMTAYAWFVWVKADVGCEPFTKQAWIPPGQRGPLTRDDDAARFGWREGAAVP